MSPWQFVLPRNWIALFAYDTLGLGIPLERGVPATGFARHPGQEAVASWVPDFGWSMNYYLNYYYLVGA